MTRLLAIFQSYILTCLIEQLHNVNYVLQHVSGDADLADWNLFYCENLNQMIGIFKNKPACTMVFTINDDIILMTGVKY